MTTDYLINVTFFPRGADATDVTVNDQLMFTITDPEQLERIYKILVEALNERTSGMKAIKACYEVLNER